MSHAPITPPAPLSHAVLDTLQRIAPEVSPASLVPTRPLREQVDLGSLDWMNFLDALQERLGIEIPEPDWAGLVTLDDLLAYLDVKLQAQARNRGDGIRAT